MTARRRGTFTITPDSDGISIEVTGVGDRQEELLASFAECQQGRCSCPTTEYEKVGAMTVESSDDAIIMRLQAKPGTAFDTREIGVCLDHTIGKAERS